MTRELKTGTLGGGYPHWMRRPGGRGQGQYCMGLGHGGPGARGGLAVSLAERPVRLSGKFLGTAVMNLFSAARCHLAGLNTWMDLASRHQPVRVQQPLVERHDRYGLGHLVSRSMQRATPTILRAVEQVHDRAAQTKTT